MGRKLSRRFAASIDRLHEMLSWIRQGAEEAGFQAPGLYQIELASEEAIVNVIQHAYAGRSGDIEITLRMAPQNRFEIVIVDNGVPFDGSSPPRGELSVDEDTVGGWGIPLMKKCLDVVEYRRDQDRNILTLTKNLTLSY